jgi:hypothetical protein
MMNQWENILQHMERRVNPHSFATWFRPTTQEGSNNGKLGGTRAVAALSQAADRDLR